MGKLTTYLMIVTGILVLFHYSGIIGADEGSVLLSYVTNPTNLRNLDVSDIIELAIQGVVVGGIAIAAIATGNLELVMMSAVTIFFWNLLTDMLIIYNKIVLVNANYVPIAVILIAVPFLVLLMVIVDWWRGRDV